MKLIALSDRNSPAFAEIWSIYESSFPPDERGSLAQQEALLKEPAYHLIAAYENDSLMGFISSWELDFTFIEHVAVKEHLRDRGAGTKLLHAFLSERKKVILEVEPPENDLKKRRIAFYKRIGFRLNSFPYLQPPYGPGKSAVPMALMSYPKALDEKEFSLVRDKLHQEVYRLEK